MGNEQFGGIFHYFSASIAEVCNQRRTLSEMMYSSASGANDTSFTTWHVEPGEGAQHHRVGTSRTQAKGGG